jgi:shikimate dehydrogenase
MISGKTSMYCLIGDPVAHSLSPLIMNRALAEHRCDGAYVAHRVDHERVGQTLQEMRAQNVRGVNVTYPLKETILGHADEVSAAAQTIGAANVLSFAAGRIRADNTDAPGTAIALETFGGVAPADRSVVIFGAGGSGRAAAWGLLEKGAGEVTFAVRDPDKAKDTCGRFSAHFSGKAVRAVSLECSEQPGPLDAILESADIVINATPVGMSGYPEARLSFKEGAIHQGQTWFDFVYHPPETDFLAAAREGGACAIGGLELLVSQAREGFRLWTGHEFSLVDMYEYVRAHRAGVDATEQR